jgi:hypothetical protein
VHTGAKLLTYAVVLAAVLGGGAAVGALAGPIDVGGTEHDAGHDTGADDGAAALPVGGLLVSQDGYTLRAASRVLEADTAQPFSFVVDGPDGTPVQAYDLTHERELHLVLVSRDLDRFAHVHPTRDAGGTWTVELPPLVPGSYRAYADFRPTGASPLTLGTDVTVPGPVRAPSALAEQREVDVDGYRVTLTGDIEPGRDSEVVVTVARDGAVTTEPYLGAAGHLVAVRDGDLAYLHVHPIDDVPAGPVRFAVEIPSTGRYGLYFDFAHGGAVHTAAFVVTTGEGDDPGGGAGGGDDDHDEPSAEEHP